MDNNNINQEYKIYLIKIFDHLIADGQNLDNNVNILIETINKLITNNFMDSEEIQNSIKKALPNLDYDDEWFPSGSWSSGTSATSYTETTSDSYMATGLDDGGVAESMGE